MRVAYFDLCGGVSGDMLVSALKHAGADFAPLEAAFAQSPYPLRYEFEEVSVSGIKGIRTFIRFAEGARWNMEEAARVLESLPISSDGRGQASRILNALLEAEAKVHGVGVEEVHLHEVGSLDTIGDVAGVIFALEQLSIERVSFSAIPMGGEPQEIAHGKISMPSPAALELARGLTVKWRESGRELATPTGIAILRELGGVGPHPSEEKQILRKTQDDGKGKVGLPYWPAQACPAMRLEMTGYGFGEGMSFTESSTRVWIGEVDPAGESLIEVETNVDDITPELAAALPNRLMQRGALDATLTPIEMKKGRHGFRIWALYPVQMQDAALDAFFEETGTFGLRIRPVERIALERKMVEVQTPFGNIPVKVGYWRGKAVTAKPEFDACEQAARALNVPLKSVMLTVTQKMREMGL